MTMRNYFLRALRLSPLCLTLCIALVATRAMAQAEHGGPVDPTFIMTKVLEVVPESERKGLRLAYIPENTSQDDATEMLKNALNTDFPRIHELCEFVLQHSQRPELIQRTLLTLHAFLSWIPLGYIFESTLLDTLLKLSPDPNFRNVALQCLAAVSYTHLRAHET